MGRRGGWRISPDGSAPDRTIHDVGHEQYARAVRTVTKRELNQNTASVLRQVTAAGDVIITERGVPRWRLSIFTDDDGPLSRLERAGLYTPPATEPAPWPAAPAGPSYTADQVAALLEDSRGDH